MPQDHKCVLCMLEENQREPRKDNEFDELQMQWPEEEGVPFSSSSSSSYSSSHSVVLSEASDEEASGEDPGIPLSPYSACSSTGSWADSSWSQLDEESANSQDEGDADSGQEVEAATVQEAEAAAFQEVEAAAFQEAEAAAFQAAEAAAFQEAEAAAFQEAEAAAFQEAEAAAFQAAEAAAFQAAEAAAFQEAEAAAVQEAVVALAQVPMNPPLHVAQVPMNPPLHLAQFPMHHSLHAKMSALVTFLLRKYHRREFTSQAEIVSEVLENQLDQLPIALVQARECLQLVFGIEMWEVDPQIHSYVMTPTLGLTYDGLTEAEDSKPKTGLLILVLGVILRGGDRASEETVWETLGVMGVFDDAQQSVFGASREFLINEWVQEQYLVCQQVPDSYPPTYEFLWGPRAYAETSKMQMLELWLQVINRHRRFPLLLCA